jgi:drug/metabolite transporter (DMT)-like permease
VTILLGSIFVLGEAASVSQVAGISSIILGTFLIVGDDSSREGAGECQEAPPEPPGTSEACEGLEP